VIAVRTDIRLIVAVVVPLLIGVWLPPWDSAVFSEGWLGAIVFCISIAVLEEVIFRGGIQGGLLRKVFFRISLLGLSRANWLTSAIFALAHIWWHPLRLVPGYLVVSLVLGYFRERYNGILVPVLLHAYYNLILLFIPVLLHGIA
jgi:membrane protease YdiL (CAAX protease family)